MPRFTVTLQRRLRDNCNRPAPNPFLAPLPHPDKKCTMSIRTWNFEAKDEAECRRLLDEAYAAGIPGVQGYTLRSIDEEPKHE